MSALYFCHNFAAMRWIKIIFAIVAFLFGVYSAVMYFFADESKEFTVVKEINYPVEKVFPQFNNFQNFIRWNNYFSSSKNLSVDFYQPYEGQGSAMSFYDKKSKRNGEMTIRYQNLNSTLKYYLFENDNANPSQIDIKFQPVGPEKTRITWYVHTPRQPLLKRAVNFWTEDVFAENLSKSMSNLQNLLSNKVEKDNQMSTIKYDSLMVENQEGMLLLGVNVSASNKKDALFKNVVMNHNKVYNFVRSDLGKNDDEIGLPIMITAAGNDKDKEVSYFYGIPLSKRVAVTDNNFSFRTVNASKSYVIYFKGNYAERIPRIKQLLQKAKKDTLRNGELMQTFMEAPEEGKEVHLKISLPVYR